MQLPRSVIAISLIGALAAACGGTPATQGPGGPGATSAGPGATTGSQATQDPGPGQTQSGHGGNGGSGSGSVKFTISGPFDKSDEYPFVPQASILGSAEGSVLNFGNTVSSSEVVSILVSADGSVIVSYSGADGQVPAATCTTSDMKVEARSVSGKFDCTASASIDGSGAVVGPGRITGEFSARG